MTEASGRRLNELKKLHTEHGWAPVDTSHIKNVDLLTTHTLMQCVAPCTWRGWIKNVVQ